MFYYLLFQNAAEIENAPTHVLLSSLHGILLDQCDLGLMLNHQT